MPAPNRRDRPRGLGRALGAGAIVALLLLIGIGGWWFLRTDDAPPISKPERASEPALTAATPAAAESSPSIEPVAAKREIEPELPALSEPGARSAPESYVREFSGLRGRVVEEDGTPVADKKVELLQLHVDLLVTSMEGGFAAPPPDLSKYPAAATTTGADGVFVLRNLEADSFSLLGVDPGGPRGTYRLMELALERGQTLDLGDVVLPPHVTFVGKVEDEDGAAVAGARVRVIPQINVPFPMEGITSFGLTDIRADCAVYFETGGVRAVVPMPPWLRAIFERIPLPTTTTDSQGGFRLPGVPAGIATLVIDRSGFLGSVRPSLPTGRREETDVGTQLLSRGRHVSGRVLAGERPVPGVRVMVGTAIAIPFFMFGDDSNSRIALLQPAGVTDAEGRFALDGLPETGQLFAAVEPHAGDPWTMLGPFEQDRLELLLPPMAALTVLVQDAASQKPIAGASLRFQAASPMNEVPIFDPPAELRGRVKEVEEGRHLVTDLALGKWRVLARAPGFGTAGESVDVVDSGSTVVVKLPTARSLRVRVIEAATGTPVDYALTAALIPIEGDFPAPFKAARTDALGEALLEQLPIGAPVTLRVTHPGFCAHFAKPPEEGSAVVEIALVRGGDLVGRVTQGGGEPGKVLMLILEPRMHDAMQEEFPRFGLTLPDGSFKVRHLPAGELRWTLMPRFFDNDPVELLKVAMSEPDELANGTVKIEEGVETRLDIEAAPDSALVAAVVRGQVRVDGLEDANVHVRLFGERYLTASCDDAGRYEFTSVKPGQYQLHVSDVSGMSQSTLHTQPVTVAAGETRDIDVDVRVSRVEFLVTTAGGEPAGGATISVEPQNPKTQEADESNSEDFFDFGASSQARTDDVGRTRLALPEGSWRATVHHEELGNAKATFETAGGRASKVTIGLEAGVAVRGRCEFQGTAPGGDEWWLVLQPVLAEGEESSGMVDGWTQVSAKERRFEFKSVAPGRYSAQLFAPGTDATMFVSDEFDVGASGARDLSLWLRPQE